MVISPSPFSPFSTSSRRANKRGTNKNEVPTNYFRIHIKINIYITLLLLSSSTQRLKVATSSSRSSPKDDSILRSVSHQGTSSSPLLIILLVFYFLPCVDTS